MNNNHQTFPCALFSIFDDSDKTYNSSPLPEEEDLLASQRRLARRAAMEARTMPSRMAA